jgi:signal transduction histidine kinase
MFFGGYGGVTAFRPDQMVDDRSAPAVALTDFQIGAVPVSPGNGSPLSNAITYSNSVTLKHSQDIFSVGFAALNFKDPYHTRYRYQLEGVDQGWREASSAQRTATYTTLPAGDYNLRVQASTMTSPWTDPGMILKVTILPAWWNTWWFRSLYLILIVAILRIAYRYRVRVMSDALALRLQERVDERARLSRELHDTLMQTIEGSRLIVDTATKPQTDPTQHRLALEKLSTWLDRASNEGRAAMQTLRGSTNYQGDLYYGLRQTVDECATQHTDRIVFPAPASRRALRPLVQEEAFHIGSEAIRNACLHADAKRIEIELRFEPDLLLRVKDDGKGMSPAVASLGREGHFGLRCMRERASRIGARLAIDSSPGAGTVVTLSVFRAIAFETNDRGDSKAMDRARLMLRRLKDFVSWS